MLNPPDPIVIRETLIGVLSTFAKIEWQLTLEYSPGELYCQWFDDVYHPDTDIWRIAFSETERHALASFTATLLCHTCNIDRRGLNELLGTKSWNDIIVSANEALNDIDLTYDSPLT